MKFSDNLEKVFAFIGLYQREVLVEVGVHPRLCSLPAHLRKDEMILLVYGVPSVLVTPIPDLEVSTLGLSATLSFNGVNEMTFVPWEVVVVIANQKLDFAKTWISGDAATADTTPPPSGDNVVQLFGRKK